MGCSFQEKEGSYEPMPFHQIKFVKCHQETYLIDGTWDYAYTYTGPDSHAILQNLDPARLAKSVSLEDLVS